MEKEDHEGWAEKVRKDTGPLTLFPTARVLNVFHSMATGTMQMK